MESEKNRESGRKYGPIEQSKEFSGLLDDKTCEEVEEFCRSNGRPWINPEFYFPVFNVGMTRLLAATSEHIDSEYEKGGGEENPSTADKMLKNLLQEYENKLLALNKIHLSKVRSKELVAIDPNLLSEAEAAFSLVQEGSVVAEFGQENAPDKKKSLLLDIVSQLNKDVLPKIVDCAKPVIDAGEFIRKKVYEFHGIKEETIN